MGEDFVVAPNVDVKQVFKETTPLNPFIFILTQGTDPREEFMK